MGRVVVVGSYNVGLTVLGPVLPVPGQTVLGDRFDMGPGGKGSNQAIGARRLGADVTLVAKVGTDVFGGQARELFEREGLMGPGIMEADTHTGVGLILVDEAGRNMIAVAPGANARLTVDDVRAIPSLFDGASHLLCQLECPPALFAGTAEIAREQGVRTVLNPAPGAPLDPGVYPLVDLLTPNETELSILAGRPVDTETEAEEAARALLDNGVGDILVTMGERGVLWVGAGRVETFPARPVHAVDSTGAGDAFNAGLVTGLAAGRSMAGAITLGIRAGAYCVTKVGVVDGLPTQDELERELPE